MSSTKSSHKCTRFDCLALMVFWRMRCLVCVETVTIKSSLSANSTGYLFDRSKLISRICPLNFIPCRIDDTCLTHHIDIFILSVKNIKMLVLVP